MDMILSAHSELFLHDQTPALRITHSLMPRLASLISKSLCQHYLDHEKPATRRIIGRQMAWTTAMKIRLMIHHLCYTRPPHHRLPSRWIHSFTEVQIVYVACIKHVGR
jgi:hypothetical protein